jgi:hypothetical protein
MFPQILGDRLVRRSKPAIEPDYDGDGSAKRAFGVKIECVTPKFPIQL